MWESVLPCRQPNCNKAACYAFRTNLASAEVSHPVFCREHKMDGMVLKLIESTGAEPGLQGVAPATTTEPAPPPRPSLKIKLKFTPKPPVEAQQKQQQSPLTPKKDSNSRISKSKPPPKLKTKPAPKPKPKVASPTVTTDGEKPRRKKQNSKTWKEVANLAQWNYGAASVKDDLLGPLKRTRTGSPIDYSGMDTMPDSDPMEPGSPRVAKGVKPLTFKTTGYAEYEKLMKGYDSSPSKLETKESSKSPVLRTKFNGPKCLTAGCTTYASYGFDDGTTSRVSCGVHKQEDMIARHERCARKDCKWFPWFKKPGSSSDRLGPHERRSRYGTKLQLYCFDHAPFGCIPRNRKTCIFKGCTNKPVFGRPRQAATFCETHVAWGAQLASKRIKAEQQQQQQQQGKPEFLKMDVDEDDDDLMEDIQEEEFEDEAAEVVEPEDEAEEDQEMEEVDEEVEFDGEEGVVGFVGVGDAGMDTGAAPLMVSV